jgi:hypothetical protein
VKPNQPALEKHRAEIVRLKEDLRIAEEIIEKSNQYANDLEDKLTIALHCMKAIAINDSFYGHDDRCDAVTGLAKIARMRERKP